MTLVAETVPTYPNIRIVGGGIFLTGNYDENQLWFSFMSNAIFEVSEPNVAAPKAHYIRNTKFVEIDPKYRRLFPTDEIYKNQYILPFPQYRQVSSKNLKLIKNKKSTSWDRDSEGNLIELHFRNNTYTREEVLEWCNDTGKGQFNLRFSPNGDIHLTFEKIDDAILAKLKFS